MQTLLLSALALCLCANAVSPFVNETDCLFRSYFLERALEVNPGLTTIQLQEMADSLNGDPIMGKGCIITVPASLMKQTQRVIGSNTAAAAAGTFFCDATSGSDSNTGSISSPFLTIARALSAVRTTPGGSPGTINLRGGGTFYLPQTLTLTPADAGLTIQTYPGDAEMAWLSGSTPLYNLTWAPVNITNGANVWRADLSSIPSIAGGGGVNSLRLGGGRLIRARYPNANPETGLPFAHHTTSADNWTTNANPTQGVYWSAPVEWSRNDSGCSSYTVAINGSSCGLYTPPIAHYCRGDGVHPVGMTVSIPKLPHQPYADPTGAVVTAMHGGSWCSFQYRIGDYTFSPGTGEGSFDFTQGVGGNQCGRPETSHGPIVIEGVLEELDTPGEYHYAPATHVLTLWHNASSGTPPPGDGTLSVPTLMTLISAQGTQATPVSGLSLTRVGFRDTPPAAFQPHTAPSGSDYAVNRASALVLEGVAGVNVSHCTFTRLDNGGVFIGGYARGVVVEDSEFAWLGESGVVTLGDTEGAPIPGWGPNATAGNYPLGTLIRRNFARELGIVNKQACFFFQAVSAGAVVDSNVVFNSARHGLQYNDDLGEGSLITNSVMFSLNRETADTGLFNNWDRLPFTPRKDKDHQDVYTHNLLLANFGSFSGFDTDDCSAYHHMEANVQLYGHALKSDFTGHDVTFLNDFLVFGSGSDQYQSLIPGYFNYMSGCQLLAAQEVDVLFSHYTCPNASDWPKVTDTMVWSPEGNVTLCGQSIPYWQAAVPGVLRNVTVAQIPNDLSAQDVLDMAKATLHAQVSVQK